MPPGGASLRKLFRITHGEELSFAARLLCRLTFLSNSFLQIFIFFFFLEKQEKQEKKAGNISEVCKFNRRQHIWNASHSNIWKNKWKIWKCKNCKKKKEKSGNVDKSPSIRTVLIFFATQKKNAFLFFWVLQQIPGIHTYYGNVPGSTSSAGRRMRGTAVTAETIADSHFPGPNRLIESWRPRLASTTFHL